MLDLIEAYLGVPAPLLFGQLLLGLINGAFYAMLSLGLAVIFGLLNIINFTHGAQFMMGAFAAWMLLAMGTNNDAGLGIGYLLMFPLFWLVDAMTLKYQVSRQMRALAFGVVLLLFLPGLMVSLPGIGPLASVIATTLDLPTRIAAVLAWVFPNGLGYWAALPLCALLVGVNGVVLERVFISRLYKLDHLYGLLLTLGLGLIIEGIYRNKFGSSGLPYRIPAELQGAWDLGFMFMPIYRGWVVVAALIFCLATWLIIEKTRLGAYLRAATERAELVQAFGINVPRMITLTYGAGVALAAVAGVLAAPIYSVNPQMGSNLIIVVFAVVVIGGMGSILGSIVTGFGLGIVEGLTKVYYPEASATVIFVIMAIVLLARPAGLFGRA